MAPKTCVFAALNIAALFALVSGCENCPPTPTPNAPKMNFTAKANTSAHANTTADANTTAVTLCSTPPSSCPRDTLKLGACSGILNGWMNFSTGMPARAHCCSLIEGLADFQVAVCLCTALKANIFGFNVDIPISFTKLINTCAKNVPKGFICK